MHPLEQLRQDLGVDRVALARLLGVAYSQLYACEKSGTALPRRTYVPLRELGADPEDIALRSREWHEAHAAQLRRELMERGAIGALEAGAS